MRGTESSERYALGFVRRSDRRRFLWMAGGVFSLTTLVVFWPYARGLSSTVSDPGDPILLIWIMEWVRRALLHTPSQLFDAPMYHPFHDTLAYSDPLLPQSVVLIALRAVGLGPIAGYNAVYLGGIAFAGVLSALLFLELTGDRTAALLGALAATFPAIRLFHLAHMQLQVTTFWPLALLLVHRLVARPDVRGAVALAFTLAACVLASLYHGMFMAVLLPVFALVAWLCSEARSRAALGALAAAGMAAGVLLAPVARVYARALSHLDQPRIPEWSDLRHYFGISRFADLAGMWPALAVSDASPQWIGGGAAWLLVLATIAIIALLARLAIRRRRAATLPAWARACLPYVVLGCMAMLLSLGPEPAWRGRALFPNPLARIASLPGMREIRDFQRLGFVLAIPAGAVLAVALALLKRHWPRIALFACVFVAISTFAPVISSSLPTYRPPQGDKLAPVYRWLAQQPEPMVLFEAPLSKESDSFEFLWASALHEKRIVHGFSGYLPLTDFALRDEATAVHRPDFWRALALLGATHLVVHTDRLAQLPGGAASLAALRELRGADRIARLPGAEVYQVVAARPTAAARLDPLRRPPSMTSGDIDVATGCVNLLPGKPPLRLFVPDLASISGLGFLPESPLGVVDEGLTIERSQNLREWRAAPHAPLLSTSLAAYLRKPTTKLWGRAEVAAEPGPFLRLSAGRDEILRICKLWVDGALGGKRAAPLRLGGNVTISAHRAPDAAKLAVDGNPNTRWQSGAPQDGSEWIELRFSRPQRVAAVVLELEETAYDRARGLALDCGATTEALEIGLETDGEDALFEQPTARQLVIMSPPRTCGVLRIRQTRRAPANYWSVWELSVYEQFP
jgi:hypothetical protein